MKHKKALVQNLGHTCVDIGTYIHW